LKITSLHYVIFQKEGDVVRMYHCIEYPLYRHQHCVTVYLNKYKSPASKTEFIFIFWAQHLFY